VKNGRLRLGEAFFIAAPVENGYLCPHEFDQPRPSWSMKDDKDKVSLSAVEDHGGILTIRGGGPRRDWNGIHYKQGMSAKNVGTTKLSANIATIPPGGVAYAHIHVGFELILYILEGKVRHEFGPGLKQVLENEAGDFIYIKPGVPHEVFNISDTEPVVAFVARSSANEWDDIIPYDRNQKDDAL
jgi:uncharacterized RmlC-like cupin family protein